MKERWFNFRPICLVFAFLLLGSVFSFYITKNIMLTIVITVLVLALLLVPIIIKKNFKVLVITLISFCVGISVYYMSIASFNKTIDYTPTTIQARIYHITNEDNGVISVEADNCYFNNKKVNTNIKLYIYDYDSLFENIEIGNVIEFKPLKFNKSDLFYYETPNSNLFNNKLKYTVTTSIQDVKYIKTDKTFQEKVKEQIKDNLSLGLTNENSEIAYSALFGDKSLLSDKQYSSYKMSGVAHLLAVSGLHVGIITTILLKLLKKINKWHKFFIIATFLGFYAFLCNFSVSVVRASIMSLILILANILGKEYDSLNAISLAGIVIFFLNPLCVFDVSFLLSFACVIGITMLYKPIRVTLRKMFAPKGVAESFAMSLATTISITFIMAFFFHNLNIISILSNILLIPLFTIAFNIVFIVSMLSLIIPVLTYILYPINYIFNFINLLATILGNLPIANLITINFKYPLIILYFVFLFFLSRFNVAKHKNKVIITLPMVALMFYCLL